MQHKGLQALIAPYDSKMREFANSKPLPHATPQSTDKQDYILHNPLVDLLIADLAKLYIDLTTPNPRSREESNEGE